MAVILCIETSTNVCSVALIKNGACLFEKVDYDGPSHASLLSPFVQEALDFSRTKSLSIDAVAVSCGPGSYTGLRIGVSTAKGLCFGLDAKLLSVSTLKLLSVSAMPSVLDESALLCPMIDARRMEVYSAIYDKNLAEKKPVSADIISAESYANWLGDRPVYFFGNGAEKCKEYLTHPHAHFLTDIYPLARNMAMLAEESFEKGKFEDVAYFEPFYLKDFIATTPKNKVLS